ncbi:MAG: hypothetical protein SPJ06_04515, partial [Bacilli bacterium]|nr:hypothetical protein [Bacilli bacterium]
MRKYKIKSKKNMFLLCLFGFFSLCIFSLTVGFCASSSTLSVDGSVLVRGAGDVRVTNVERVNASDDVDLKDLHLETDSTFSLDCKLKTIWSKVSFEVTVVNLSSTDVVVTDINELVPLNT